MQAVLISLFFYIVFSFSFPPPPSQRLSQCVSLALLPAAKSVTLTSQNRLPILLQFYVYVGI